MIFTIAHFSIIISVALIAYAATKIARANKARHHTLMMIGAWLQIGGVLCMEVSPFFTPHVTAKGEGPISIPMNIFDILSRLLIAAGMIAFSSGFTLLALKNSNAEEA